MKKTIWILLDNRIGSRHQAEGVANYLKMYNFNVVDKEIGYTRWAALPNFIRGKTLLGIDTLSKGTLVAPWPDFVLSASRRTAPVARWIKKQNPATKLVQLLHIGCMGAKDFEAIFAPEHDKGKFSPANIIYTVGSPHFITQEKLDEAQKTWSEKFCSLPHPITALIIGGAIKKRQFTLENATDLALKVKKLKEKEGGSVLITTSRRTGAEAEKTIMSILEGVPQFTYLWGDKNPNPYLGFLACADNLIVTGDSVSMCCEATATHKPLQIFVGAKWLTAKHLRFVNTLVQNGFATILSDEKAEKKPGSLKELNVAKDVAEKISKL